MNTATRIETPSRPLSRTAKIVGWSAQLAAAAILGQTLFFKFAAAPESVWIFQTLGVEPWGRWAAGLAELVAVVMLLVPRTAVWGAMVALGVMAGAIGSHLTRLGIAVQGDGGLLFGLALVVTAAATVVLVVRRAELTAGLDRLRGRTAAGHSRATGTALAALVGIGLAAATATAGDGGMTAAVTGDGNRVAIVAGGCFWGMEHLLRDLDGVVDTEVGYAKPADDKRIGSAEAVRVVFDPAEVSYEEVLRFYFRIHDPTTLNRQGNDRGTEYRSAVFVLDHEQRRIAEKVRAEVEASGFWERPLVTRISDTASFKVASKGHQDYLVKNPGGYTCHFIRGE
jgi:methionine-S-sulfoxide reductase